MVSYTIYLVHHSLSVSCHGAEVVTDAEVVYDCELEGRHTGLSKHEHDTNNSVHQ